MKIDWSLYLITDRKLSGDRDLVQIIKQAIDGGITALQVRDKTSSTIEFCRLAEELLKITSSAKIPLIINDRIDIALAVGADGVHLGQEDLPYHKARNILGSKPIIGMTVSNIEELKLTTNWDIAYLGVGPIYHTTTKEKSKDPILLDGLKKIIAATSHKVIAIGGITSSHVYSIIESGATGIAVVSAIIGSDNPKNAAKGLLNSINEARMQLRLL